MDMATPFAAGFGGMLMGAGVITLWWRANMERHAELRRRMEEKQAADLLKVQQQFDAADRRLVDHERQLQVHAHHLEPLNATSINQQLVWISATLASVATKLDAHAERAARMEERLNGLQSHCDRLQKDVDALRR